MSSRMPCRTIMKKNARIPGRAGQPIGGSRPYGVARFQEEARFDTPLLVRYAKNENGTIRKVGCVYTQEEHGIRRSDIDPDAIRITDKLKAAGFEVYIVGGSIRDLMVGKKPKDFDIATDAQPKAIRKLFWNSRIIGKRFRLVHIFFGSKIIEVATFRAPDSSGYNATYGTLEEDVKRRDFRVNAMYYDPKEQVLIDYVKGMEDIRDRTIRPLIPLNTIFTEDPVRIIRAIKYASGLTFRIPFLMRLRMKNQSRLLGDISPSRLTEELFKILESGRSTEMIAMARKFGALKYLLPELDRMLSSPSDGFTEEKLIKRLESLDQRVREGQESRRGRMLGHLAADYLTAKGCLAAFREDLTEEQEREALQNAVRTVKEFLKPLVAPNIDVEMAVRYAIRKKTGKRVEPVRMQEIRPQQRQRRRGGRNRGAAEGQIAGTGGNGRIPVADAGGNGTATRPRTEAGNGSGTGTRKRRRRRPPRTSAETQSPDGPGR